MGNPYEYSEQGTPNILHLMLRSIAKKLEELGELKSKLIWYGMGAPGTVLLASGMI